MAVVCYHNGQRTVWMECWWWRMLVHALKGSLSPSLSNKMAQQHLFFVQIKCFNLLKVNIKMQDGTWTFQLCFFGRFGFFSIYTFGKAVLISPPPPTSHLPASLTPNSYSFTLYAYTKAYVYAYVYFVYGSAYIYIIFVSKLHQFSFKCVCVCHKW